MQNISLSKHLFKIIFSLIFLLTVVSVTAQTPSGFNLVAYEGFDYTSGTSLLNANGGAGWSSSWVKTYNQEYLKISATGFTYSGLTTSGLKADFDATCYGGTCNQIAAIGRSFPLQDRGVVYFQFISVFEANGGFGTPTIRLYNGAVLTGVIGAQSGSLMSICSPSANLSSSSASLSAQNMVIVRIDYNLNKTDMWVNPNLSTFNYSNPPISDASATSFAPAFDKLDINIRSGSIDEISIFAQPTTAPTNISGTASVCAGTSTTLTSSGGSTGTDGVDVWYEGSCGGDAFHEGFNTQPTVTYQTTVNSNLNGILNVTTTSVDPEIEMYNLGSFDPTVYKYINFRYRVVSGTAGEAQMFFLNSTDVIATGSKYLSKTLVSDNQWHTVSVDMSTHALWATGGNITGIRYDYATLSGATLDLDFIELSAAPIIGTGSSITVAPTATTTYYANRKGYNVNSSCISQAVTVNALPVPSFTTQAGAIVVINTDVTYTTQPGQTNYIWTIPGVVNTNYTITSGGTSSDNTLVLKWLTNGSKIVSINYSNTNNCSGAIATSSNSVIVRNNGISINGSKISNPSVSIDSNGKIGSGKSISSYGELMDSPLPPPKVVGETYQGGTIFYLSASGSDGIQHGLIRTGIYASNVSYNTVISTTIPNANTAVLNGYSDWRLPNFTEAQKICQTGAGFGMMMSSTPNGANIDIVWDNSCVVSNITKTYAAANFKVVLVRSF
jgi:hypothetical protein